MPDLLYGQVEIKCPALVSTAENIGFSTELALFCRVRRTVEIKSPSLSSRAKSNPFLTWIAPFSQQTEEKW